jgi:hypothetical protein
MDSIAAWKVLVAYIQSAETIILKPDAYSKLRKAASVCAAAVEAPTREFPSLPNSSAVRISRTIDGV